MDPRAAVSVMLCLACGAGPAAVDASASDDAAIDASAAIDERAPPDVTIAEADPVIQPRDTSPPTANDAGAFAPCPADAPCRIMPLGDSLTYGVGSATGGGYRAPLFAAALAAQQSVTFVGSMMNGPATVGGVPFPAAHEGYRGYSIDPGGGREGLSPLVDRVLAARPPHIVLLLAGTNDVGAAVIDAPHAPDRLGALVDRIAAAAPAALVVVAQIPPSMDDAANSRIMAFNAALPAVVAARAAMGRHVVLVDAYGALAARADYKKALMFNQFHPNDAGYALIADRWYAAVKGYLH
jgi:lysophospholipase L1-like esterase